MKLPFQVAFGACKQIVLSFERFVSAVQDFLLSVTLDEAPRHALVLDRQLSN